MSKKDEIWTISSQHYTEANHQKSAQNSKVFIQDPPVLTSRAEKFLQEFKYDSEQVRMKSKFCIEFPDGVWNLSAKIKHQNWVNQRRYEKSSSRTGFTQFLLQISNLLAREESAKTIWYMCFLEILARIDPNQMGSNIQNQKIHKKLKRGTLREEKSTKQDLETWDFKEPFCIAQELVFYKRLASSQHPPSYKWDKYW